MTSKTKKRTVLATNGCFQLIYQERNNKSWHEIKFDDWAFTRHSSNVGSETRLEIIAYFRARPDSYDTTWRFWNRTEAHKQFLYATLRWN